MSQQVSSSFQQSLIYQPIPIWPVDSQQSGLRMNASVDSAVDSDSQGQSTAHTYSCESDAEKDFTNSRIKDVNDMRINVNKDLNKTNGSSDLPLLQNCFQQKYNYYNISNNNTKNDSINGSNDRNNNISYSNQSEPTYAINSFNSSYVEDCPLMKQLLSKNSKESISYSARAATDTIHSNPVQANNYLCVGRNGMDVQGRGQTNLDHIKQTNDVSTQTDCTLKSNHQNKQLNDQQLSAWQMNRAVKAYLIFSTETKSKILYKERVTTSLSPNEELAMEQRLRLMVSLINIDILSLICRILNLVLVE